MPNDAESVTFSNPESNSDDDLEAMRGAPRYNLLPGRELDVALEQIQGARLRSVEAVALNISLSGVKLLVEETMAVNHPLLVRFHAEDVGTDVQMAGRAIWARPAQDGRWRLGCAFDKPLPQPVIDHLAKKGNIDRRESPREEVAVEAAGRFEAHTGQVSLRLFDLSEGGFSMLSSRPAEPGKKIRIRLGKSPDEPEVVATVKWRRSTRDGYLMGCAFHEQDPAAAEVVKRLLRNGDDEAEPETDRAVPPQDPASTALARKTKRAYGKLLLAASAMAATLVLLELASSVAGGHYSTAAFLCIASAAALTLQFHSISKDVLKGLPQLNSK